MKEKQVQAAQEREMDWHQLTEDLHGENNFIRKECTKLMSGKQGWRISIKFELRCKTLLMECQRYFESKQLTNSEKNNLTELSLIANFIVDTGYDNGDEHCHYGFYAKSVYNSRLLWRSRKRLGVNHELKERVVV